MKMIMEGKVRKVNDGCVFQHLEGYFRILKKETIINYLREEEKGLNFDKVN